MTPLEAKKMFPRRADVGKLRTNKKGGRTKGYDRFAKASKVTVAAPVLGSTAFRVRPLTQPLLPLADKVWSKIAPMTRQPLFIEPKDPEWKVATACVEDAWSAKM